MLTMRFDFNDNGHEPSDEALAASMETVAEETLRSERNARDNMVSDLRRGLKEVHERA